MENKITKQTERHVMTDERIMQQWFNSTSEYDCLVPEAICKFARELLSTAPQVVASATVEQVEAKEGEQHVWIAYNAEDDDDAVMFFTEQPGQELKDRFFLKHYICRPAPSSQKEGEI